jgi:hypothetical protein
MPKSRQKFATQVNSEILAALADSPRKKGASFKHSWTRPSPT